MSSLRYFHHPFFAKKCEKWVPISQKLDVMTYKTDFRNEISTKICIHYSIWFVCFFKKLFQFLSFSLAKNGAKIRKCQISESNQNMQHCVLSSILFLEVIPFCTIAASFGDTGIHFSHFVHKQQVIHSH